MRIFAENPFFIPSPHSAPIEQLQPDEIAYHVPLEHGVLQVTPAAHEAYNLQPLVPGVTKGVCPNLAVGTKYAPSVRITLLAPGEWKKDETAMVSNKNLAATNRLILSKGLLDQYVSFGKTEKQSTESILRDIGVGTGEPIVIIGEGGDTTFLGDDELQEFISQQTPQTYAHALANTLGNVTRQGARQYLEMMGINNIYRQSTVAGKIAVAESIAIVGLFSIPDGRPGVIGLALGASNLVMNQVRANASLKRGLRRQVLESPTYNNAKANALADAIESSVHDIFCAAHFNQRIAREFGDPSADQ